ncbi:MAG: DUF11 domain-containing protein [Fuerstiella sp.]|nr:DUF11 domain-containing protein [Fuerstiella sp.]MCP4857653.1 DUF11 domain-containing protein [Fuerstiella sp.]
MEYLLLGMVFLLCLRFLAMIFGERLSLFGFLEGNWLAAPFELAGQLWDMVCEAVDRIWCFVFDHFWWVTATVSGGVGVALISLLMVSGLSLEAKAVRDDQAARMNVGSVLDHTPVLKPSRILLTNGNNDGLAQASQLIYQKSSGDTLPIPATWPSVVSDLPAHRWPDSSASRLQLSMEPFVERRGRQVRSRRMGALIQQAVMSLRHDNWRTFSGPHAFAGAAASPAPLREDSEFAVEDLAAAVRILPGEFFSSNEVQVEKRTPRSASSSVFDIEIRVTNTGRERLNGLIVRELLPQTWLPVDVQPRAVYRDSVVMWLVDLDPFQEQVLQLRVKAVEPGPDQSLTEVSASAAVRAIVPVSGELRRRPTPDEMPDYGRRLPIVERPEVKLTLEKLPTNVTVGDWVNVRFRVRNAGTAPAEGVSLRITLPYGLDHRTLDDDDVNRLVESNVARLQANESREMTLSVRPTVGGRHLTIAQLVLQDEELDLRDFEIVAQEESMEDTAPIVPVPDFN